MKRAPYISCKAHGEGHILAIRNAYCTRLNLCIFQTDPFIVRWSQQENNERSRTDEDINDRKELYELYVSNVILPGGNLAPM